MNTNSPAKIAQIAQFAISATVAHGPEETSCSMISTGISANVAARTMGSKGWLTRPSGPCCHIEPPIRGTDWLPLTRHVRQAIVNGPR